VRVIGRETLLREPGAADPPAPGRWKRNALASVVLLVPCFWQARIQAGDLGSHIYNAWLAELIRLGRAPGLSIVPQKTNVLFDLLLGGLFHAVGSAAAQRIAVSLAVLVFVWGAFAFVATVAGREWRLLPAVAMLAYGWVFHMGLFNFYLSLGLCLWALALGWHFVPRRVLAAVPILAVAYVAHSLPVVWVCAVLGFLWLARRWPAGRGKLMVTAVVVLCAIHIAIMRTMPAMWSGGQIEGVAGTDQTWVYDSKYWIVAFGLLLICVALAAESVRRDGARRLFGGDLFQVLAVTAAGIFLLPDAAWLPIYDQPLLFIAQRMSLAAGVLALAVAATGRPRGWHGWSIGALAALFFVFLYADERTLNRFEDRMSAAVEQLPPLARVVANVDPRGRIRPLTHAIDRVCIGRCYSYANYEPSSAAFRIRVTGQNGIVAPTAIESSRMELGTYVVQQSDLSLYRVSVAADGSLAVESMAAGTRIGLSQWNGLRRFE
jgi:hypothetical protein